jgi:hypothetical protein
MLRNLIVDPKNLRAVEVTSVGAMKVAADVPDVPGLGAENRYRYYSELLVNSTSSTNMAVDGSVTPIEFTIPSAEDADIYIMKLAVVVADSQISHNLWMSTGALTVGWDLLSNESGVDTYIVQKVKTIGQLIIQSGFQNPFGDQATSWELNAYTGNADAALVLLNIGDIVPNGIRIGRQSQDKIVAVVNDDQTDLTDMQVRVFGYKHYPAEEF